MNNTVIIPKTGNCINFKHSIQNFCLPVKIDCFDAETNGFLVECDKQWNDNLMCQTDSEYFIPIPEDEKFIIQTRFYDESNRKNPSTGWGGWINASLYGINGLITDNYTLFTDRAGVGFDGTHNYQNLEIDTSLIGESCFYVKIMTDGGKEFCTEWFNICPCDKVVKFESIRSKDCTGAYYGTTETTSVGDDFAYSNRIWLRGHKKYFGSNIEVEDDEFIPVEVHRFYATEKVPPFMVKYLTGSILSGSSVFVDGQEYNYNPSNIQAGNNSMFTPILEFTKNCSSNLNGSGLCD